MGEYVAIGRSLLQQCHWGKKSPLGEDGRGRDREIAPTALPLGEEVAIGGRNMSRSGDRSYSNAIGGRGRHWGLHILPKKTPPRSGDRSFFHSSKNREPLFLVGSTLLTDDRPLIFSSSFRAFSLIWRVSSLVWRVPSGI